LRICWIQIKKLTYNFGEKYLKCSHMEARYKNGEIAFKRMPEKGNVLTLIRIS
jgi:hypothetical protein